MRDYVAFYNGKSIYFKAEGLYPAKKKALALFRPPKSKEGLVAVVLSDVPLSTASLG